jgi:hypothetical protein
VNDIIGVDSLAARIDALAQECRQLSKENAELRNQVAALMAEQVPMPVPRYPVPDREPESAGAGISRRAVGVAFAGAAAGIVGAAAVGNWSGSRAAAAHPEDTTAELLAADEEAAGASAAGASAASSETFISAILATSAPVVGVANSGTGPGVEAASKSGRGGVFGGSAAQIQLSPGKSSHPRSGERGDLYADSTGRLWFCKKSGSRATWHQIA